MSEKEIEKKQIFKTKNGKEISERMVYFFKKYTIPEMKTAEKNRPKENYYTVKPEFTIDDAIKELNGGLPLFNH